MGLLDDAIREHMELKRLRGADPSELARQEQDALGPVVREGEDEEQAFEDGSGHGETAEQDGALGPGDEGEQTTGDDADGDERAHSGYDTSGDGDGAGTPPARAPDFASVGQETAELDMRAVLGEQHEAEDRADQVDSAGLQGDRRRMWSRSRTCWKRPRSSCAIRPSRSVCGLSSRGHGTSTSTGRVVVGRCWSWCLLGDVGLLL